MGIKEIGSFLDGNDLSLQDLQQVTHNLDIAYDSLVSKGRGVVAWKQVTTDAVVTGTAFTPTVIVSGTATLVPGRLYKMVMEFNLTSTSVGATDVKKENVSLVLNGTIIRSMNFYTPNAPAPEALFIPTQEGNTYTCNGVLLKVGGSPTSWTANFTSTRYGILYIEDLGDPGSVVLP